MLHAATIYDYIIIYIIYRRESSWTNVIHTHDFHCQLHTKDTVFSENTWQQTDRTITVTFCPRLS